MGGRDQRGGRGACWRRRLPLLFAAFVSGGPASAGEEGLSLLVQGPRAEEQGRVLAAHLSRRVAMPIHLRVADHVLDHWIRVRRDGGADLVVDEAHFTDYRAGRFDYRVIARVAGTQSFHLLARRSDALRGPEDLWARRVAAVPAPSLAALRLLDLFAHPIRAPILQVATSHRHALELLAAGEVQAAFVPVGWRLGGAEFAVVLESEETPGMAVSLSPRVGAETEAAIRDALLGRTAPDSRGGTGTPVAALRFEAAGTERYSGYARLLRGTFGYPGR